jgi:hypothetical protein
MSIEGTGVGAGDLVVFHDKRWPHLIMSTIIGLGEGAFRCDICHEVPPWINGTVSDFSFSEVDGFRVIRPTAPVDAAFS